MVTAAPSPLADDSAAPTAQSWIGLALLVLVYMLNFIDRNIIAILAEDIKADLGLRDDQLGFLYGTAFGIFYALFGIAFGRLADAWHRIRLISLGLAFWSAMTAASAFARDFASLATARLGVGIGEATASPAAYSLISDWFPPRLRATALAIYSGGLYVGSGLSLLIGAQIVERWNAAYPANAPLGLAGWQAAFLIVGLPGLALAAILPLVREPARALSDPAAGTCTASSPMTAFAQTLLTTIPPLTLLAAARRGGSALKRQLRFAAALALSAALLAWLTGSAAQWIALAIGLHALASWADALRHDDPAAHRLLWGNRAFLCTVAGYGCVSFMGYALAFWSAPYAIRVLGIAPSMAGWVIGSNAALAGMIGVLCGGYAADRLHARYRNGRLFAVLFALIATAFPVVIGFGLADWPLFTIMHFLAVAFASSGLGAAAGASQELVPPRLKGTATACFFVGTTLIGLALGPYVVGLISEALASLGQAMVIMLGVAPIGVALIVTAMRAPPAA